MEARVPPRVWKEAEAGARHGFVGGFGLFVRPVVAMTQRSIVPQGWMGPLKQSPPPGQWAECFLVPTLSEHEGNSSAILVARLQALQVHPCEQAQCMPRFESAIQW